MNRLLLIIAFCGVILGFVAFYSPVLNKRVPIPLDALVGLYHPFRDYYAAEYTRGVPIKNAITVDPVTQIIPWKTLVVESMRNFTPPLWNPYMMAGYPLLANIQSSALYPANLFLFLFPFIPGWVLLIISQQILGFIFMYLYLRNLRLSSFASILGGVAFSFSGFFVAWLEWGNIVHTALWLPFLLLCIDQLFFSKKRVGWAIGLFIGIVFSYLAGHLQSFFYLGSFSGIYFLHRTYLERDKKAILSGIFSFFLAFLLLLPIITIQFQFISHSARSVDLDWKSEGWFLPPQHLVQFIAPDFFGNPTTQNYWGVWNYGEFIGYIGILPFLFALFAVVQRRDKKTYLFLGTIILSLLFMLPTLLAKLPFKLELPFISSSQPTRLMILVDFSLAALAALGFDRFMKEPKRFFIPLSILGGLLGLAFVLGLNGFLSQSITSDAWRVSQRNLVIPSLLLGIGIGIVVLCTFLLKREQERKLVYVGIILVTVAELVLFARKYSPFAETRFFYPQTKIISFLSEKSKNEFVRVMETDRRILHPNIAAYYHILSIDGYDPLYLRSYGELVAAMGRRKPDISTPWGFSRILTPDAIDNRISNLLGVKYILSFRNQEEPYLKQVMKEGEIYVFENKNVFPRAFFVKTVLQKESKQQILDEMFAPNTNLREFAYVEKTADLSEKEEYDMAGIARIQEYKSEKVVVKTKTATKGFLVLTDSFYPTWKVRVDGKEEKIYKTDYHFRGVVVPSGEHTVEFYNSIF